jgi:hypothetical protein
MHSPYCICLVRCSSLRGSLSLPFDFTSNPAGVSSIKKTNEKTNIVEKNANVIHLGSSFPSHLLALCAPAAASRRTRLCEQRWMLVAYERRACCSGKKNAFTILLVYAHGTPAVKTQRRPERWKLVAAVGWRAGLLRGRWQASKAHSPPRMMGRIVQKKLIYGNP